MAKAKSPTTTGERAARSLAQDVKKLNDLKKDTTRLGVAFLNAYEKLWSAPAIRNDPAARALMLRIARARKIGQIESLVLSLSRRVDELLGVTPKRRRPQPAQRETKFRRLDLACGPQENAEESPQRLFLVL